MVSSCVPVKIATDAGVAAPMKNGDTLLQDHFAQKQTLVSFKHSDRVDSEIKRPSVSVCMCWGGGLLWSEDFPFLIMHKTSCNSLQNQQLGWAV